MITVPQQIWRATKLGRTKPHICKYGAFWRVFTCAPDYTGYGPTLAWAWSMYLADKHKAETLFGPFRG